MAIILILSLGGIYLSMDTRVTEGRAGVQINGLEKEEGGGSFISPTDLENVASVGILGEVSLSEPCVNDD